ncbi:MAG: hypothetical protein ACXWEW_02720 [Nitrososphaeraceae archaeon]
MNYEYYAEVNIDEEIYCNNVTNSNDFEIFTTNVNGHNKITGFIFKFEHDGKIDTDHIDHFFLNKLILHYLDFLSSITLYPLKKNYYSTNILDLSGYRVLTVNIQIPFTMRKYVDIDLSKYQNTLSDLSPEKIENFRYYYAGVLFFNLLNYINSICILTLFYYLLIHIIYS